MANLNSQARWLIEHNGRGGAKQNFWINPPKQTIWFDAGAAPPLPEIPGANVYYSVHPSIEIPLTNARGKAAPPEKVRSQNAYISAINCLFAEFDQSKGATRDMIRGLDPKPTVVIGSGGGYHLYWCLRDPFEIKNEEDRQRAKHLQAIWVAQMGGDPDAKDLARVLRVPFTYNFKYTPPRPVDILVFEPKLLYSLDDLAQLLPTQPEQEELIDSLVASLNNKSKDRCDKWLAQALRRTVPGDQNGHGRNATGFWLACQLRDDGMSLADAEAVLRAFAQSAPQVPGEAPYTEQEAISSARSAYVYPPRKPADSPSSREGSGGNRGGSSVENDPSSPNRLGLNDVGNGKRLASRCGDRLHFVQGWGWMIWNGKYWEKDRMGTIMRMAKETARSIYREAVEAADEKDAKDLARWANSSHSRSRLEAMIAMASSEDPIPLSSDVFDKDSKKINVQNGLLDLATGELAPHHPSRLVTKIAGASYHKGNSECPRFLAFLNRIMRGDQDLVGFLQRSVGYTLMGNPVEQVLFFLYGSGANGKTTLIKTLLHIIGGYGKQAAPQLIVAGSRHPTEVADLNGARMIATIEVEQGQRMAEVLVKQLTGGDRIKARYMGQDFFEYEPTFALWLAANHKPVVRGTDRGIWRRILLIPFVETIPDHEKDPHLLEKLQAEGDAILGWAVEGSLRYQERGLDPPAIVRQATDEYKTEMDNLGHFIQECCVIHDLATVSAGELYRCYRQWEVDNGLIPLSQPNFSRAMVERGYSTDPKRPGGRDNRGRMLVFGIGLPHPESGE